MKEKLLTHLISILIGSLNSEMLKGFVDVILDYVENYVQTSETKIDDAIALPLCQLIRNTFDIPDND